MTTQSQANHDQNDQNRKPVPDLDRDDVVRASTDVIIGLSLDGLITTWSEAAHLCYGLDRGQATGLPYHHLLPADRHEEPEQLLSLIRDRRGAIVPRTVRVRSDGQPFTVTVNAVPVCDVTGTPISAVIIETDASARLQKEDNVRRANEMLTRLNIRLSQAFQENEAFSYSVSHDLREPLRAINGFSRALDEDYRDQLDQPARHYLDRIRCASQRMADLIDDVLRLSRLSRQDLVLRQLDLSEIARSIIDRLRQEDPSRSVELIIKDPMLAVADRRLMTMALENLLRNAWKFTARQASPTIELGLEHDDDETVYYIADNGCGLHPDQLEEIFLPFRRGRQAENYSGTGIGLAVVKRIIERHHGTIRCRSQLNQGATFHFTLNIQE